MSDLNNAYDQHNAGMLFADTVDVDMTLLYGRFLPLLPEAAQVRDTGCGSGRDALAFAKRGHRVTAFDASPALVALAALHGGRGVGPGRGGDLDHRRSAARPWLGAVAE
ncbi:class I SAM-dependent methyltransferase [Thiohalocapsa halophila]|uniref:class I SAM-dependent methyltransferase n=1 Tax=Thiohalocapsa halophila TaxID=69359 RepID=UPI002ADDB428|nr:methyltransferase domain-containing protein [Thiohalocapsa halophila]